MNNSDFAAIPKGGMYTVSAQIRNAPYQVKVRYFVDGQKFGAVYPAWTEAEVAEVCSEVMDYAIDNPTLGVQWTVVDITTWLNGTPQEIWHGR